MVDIKIPLTETATQHLSEIIDTENSKGAEELSPGRWCLKRILDELKASAPLINRLEESGKIDIAANKSITVKDLKSFPLDSVYIEGIEIHVGDYTKKRIEKAASFIEAATHVQGVTIPWSNSNEWCLKVVEESIARAYSKLDSELLDAEEKENYPSAQKKSS